MVHPIYQLYRNKVKSDHSAIKKQFKCVERIKADFLIENRGLCFLVLAFHQGKEAGKLLFTVFSKGVLILT